MPDAHDLPAAIQWHEGMLLAPQHFQQLSLRNEALLHYHTMLLCPFHWGVRRLKIDTGLLVNGTFRVLELEAVLPDGLVVSHTHGDGEAMDLDLTAHTEERPQAVLTVHLAVPSPGAGQAVADTGFARYRSVESDPVADANTGENGLRMPELKPQVSLLVADTPPKKYVTFPLARVDYKDQRFALTEFVAPTLSVPVQSPIGEICSQIVKRLREKATFLAEKARISAGTLELPLILETKMLVQSLVGSLPLLEGVLYTGSSHPYALYLALCSVVGHTAALGTGLVPVTLAPYAHNDLRSTFDQIQSYVFRMLEEGIMEAFTAIPFHYAGGVFSMTFHETWMSRPLVLGVRRHSDQAEGDVVSWIRGSLIGSADHIQTMRENRVLGVARQQIERDEELVAARGMIFFSLEVDPRFVEPDKELQVLNTADPAGVRRPAEIVLYVKNE